MDLESGTKSPVRGLLATLLCVGALALGCAKKAPLEDLASGKAAPAAETGSALLQLEGIRRPTRHSPSEERQLAVVPAEDRKLIRNASLTLEVDSAVAAAVQVRALVGAVGGYVGNESLSEDGYGAKRASLTCRVPAESLDELLEQAQAQGKVESIRITADDITEQYFDLEIRLSTKSELESRLLELLDRSSNDLSDLLQIERELARVRSELDQLEGQRRFWDHQVAMATLQLELHEARPAIAGHEGGVLRTVGRAFHDAGNNFVEAVAFLISSAGGLIPIVGTLGVLIWFLLRLRRRS